LPRVIYENVDIMFIEIYRIHLSFLKVIFLKSNPFWFKEIVILVNNKQKWRHQKGYAIKHYAMRNVDHRSHF
jgi:hypothetical protein